eukprot:5336045-Alexandrium_andersonii.AAC.1
MAASLGELLCPLGPCLRADSWYWPPPWAPTWGSCVGPPTSYSLQIGMVMVLLLSPADADGSLVLG